jgi:apolipoprotein N-acyltransferase
MTEKLPTKSPARRLSTTWGTGVSLLLATFAFLTLSFPPYYAWFLALVSLAPLTLCIIRRPLNWRWLLAYELTGFLFFVVNLRWLTAITTAGTFAVAAFLGLYFVLFAIGVHRLVVHLRWPALLAVPLVWVSAEYLRTIVLTGFPWFILGNSLGPVLPLIQIADLLGVWGVSFFIGLTSGWLVDVLRLPLRKGPSLNPALIRLTAIYAIIALFVVAYGLFRLHQNTFSRGPSIGVIQKYIPQTVKDQAFISDSELASLQAQYNQATTPEAKNRVELEYNQHIFAHQKKDVFDPYIQLTYAAAQQAPDLIAWPETMVPGALNREFLKRDPATLKLWDQAMQAMSCACDQELTTLCNAQHVQMLVGADGKFAATDPAGKPADYDQNLAIHYVPGTGQQPGFYAKRHLVPFGEYVPFKDSWPWLHKQLMSFTPYPDQEYGVAPGNDWYRFTTTTRDGRTFRFGTPICYENTMPYPSRSFVDPIDGKKQVDVLVSISNDGWYCSPSELDQHLQMDQLRAVENRVPFARAVNGGDSGFIDSNGRVLAVVDGDGKPQPETKFGIDGFAVHELPLDSRVTLYSRIGDLFPMLCGILTALAVGWTIVRPRRGIPKT